LTIPEPAANSQNSRISRGLADRLSRTRSAKPDADANTILSHVLDATVFKSSMNAADRTIGWLDGFILDHVQRRDREHGAMSKCRLRPQQAASGADLGPGSTLPLTAAPRTSRIMNSKMSAAGAGSGKTEQQIGGVNATVE